MWIIINNEGKPYETVLKVWYVTTYPLGIFATVTQSMYNILVHDPQKNCTQQKKTVHYGKIVHNEKIWAVKLNARLKLYTIVKFNITETLYIMENLYCGKMYTMEKLYSGVLHIGKI